MEYVDCSNDETRWADMERRWRAAVEAGDTAGMPNMLEMRRAALAVCRLVPGDAGRLTVRGPGFVVHEAAEMYRLVAEQVAR